MPLYTCTQHQNTKQTLLGLVQETMILMLKSLHKKLNGSLLGLGRKINGRSQQKSRYLLVKQNIIHLMIAVRRLGK